MADCRVNGSEGVAIESAAQMFGRFSGELVEQMPCGGNACTRILGNLELEVHRASTAGAGQVFARLIAVVRASAELDTARSQTKA